jgi:hypothetical protein
VDASPTHPRRKVFIQFVFFPPRLTRLITLITTEGQAIAPNPHINLLNVYCKLQINVVSTKKSVLYEPPLVLFVLILVFLISPQLKVVVHWAVTAPGNKDLLCFEVPARITS